MGLRRLFLWTHAELWWQPGELRLDDLDADSIAKGDLLAVDVLASASKLQTDGTPTANATGVAADLLTAYCDELLALLESHGDREEVLHQWLHDRRHWLFLDPDPAEVRSKVPFGPHVSDFVIRRSDGSYRLIEIESAVARIFKADHKPTADFNNACQQVRDWRRYVRDNVSTVRAEQRLPDIDCPSGMVLMGRSSQIKSPEAKTRWRDIKATGDLEYFTYDEICDRVRTIAENLKKMI